MEFPREFLESKACIKFVSEQAPEIAELCDRVGQERYMGLVSWVRENCGEWAWAFVSRGCVHVGVSERTGMEELLWDDLVAGSQDSNIQIDVFDTLL